MKILYMKLLVLLSLPSLSLANVPQSSLNHQRTCALPQFTCKSDPFLTTNRFVFSKFVKATIYNTKNKAGFYELKFNYSEPSTQYICCKASTKYQHLKSVTLNQILQHWKENKNNTVFLAVFEALMTRAKYFFVIKKVNFDPSKKEISAEGMPASFNNFLKLTHKPQSAINKTINASADFFFLTPQEYKNLKKFSLP